VGCVTSVCVQSRERVEGKSEGWKKRRVGRRRFLLLCRRMTGRKEVRAGGGLAEGRRQQEGSSEEIVWTLTHPHPEAVQKSRLAPRSSNKSSLNRLLLPRPSSPHPEPSPQSSEKRPAQAPIFDPAPLPPSPAPAAMATAKPRSFKEEHTLGMTLGGTIDELGFSLGSELKQLWLPYPQRSARQRQRESRRSTRTGSR
jgi:hypothetical protein